MDVTKSGATPPLGLEELLASIELSEEPPEEGYGSHDESSSSDDEGVSSMAGSAFARRFTMPTAQSDPVIRTRSHLSIDPSVLSPPRTGTSRTSDTAGDDLSSWTISTKSSRRSLGSVAGSASGAARIRFADDPRGFFHQDGVRFLPVSPGEVGEISEIVMKKYFKYTNHAEIRKLERRIGKDQVRAALSNMLSDGALVAKCNDLEVRRYSIYRFVGEALPVSSNSGTSSGSPNPERVIVIADLTDTNNPKIITCWTTTKKVERLRREFRIGGYK